MITESMLREQLEMLDHKVERLSKERDDAMRLRAKVRRALERGDFTPLAADGMPGPYTSQEEFVRDWEATPMSERPDKRREHWDRWAGMAGVPGLGEG